jgi:outer membrane protein insertion porin family
VQGTSDQVDVNVKVTERATGNLTFGVGYSNAEGVIFSGGISQSNIFGTGNALALQLSTGSVNKVYSLSYTNPYYTDDGVSRGFDIYRRDVDSSTLSVASYNTSTTGAGVRFGIPITEYDTVNYGLAVEQTGIGILPDTPLRYRQFVREFGENPNTLLATVGWARDKRDSVIFTTRGTSQKLNAEVGLPPGDLTFYRTNYQHQWYYPLTKEYTLMLNGQIGYADGYDQKPLPFYKVFYLGGVNSLRGYETATIGPKDSNGDSLGGSHMMLVNAEFLFPFPGLQKDRSVRLSWFVDAGMVGETYDFDEVRYSTGLGFSWYSPVGPLKLSFAKALNPEPDDRLQRIQFTLGTVF